MPGENKTYTCFVGLVPKLSNKLGTSSSKFEVVKMFEFNYAQLVEQKLHYRKISRFQEKLWHN